MLYAILKSKSKVYKKSIFLSFFIALSIFLPSVAQKNPSIKIVAWVKKDRILLRFAPNTQLAWEECNHTGFKIERVTLNTKPKSNFIISKILLTPTPIKPAPLQNWKTIINTEEYAPIAAQAIFGNSFEVGNNGGLAQWITKARESENKFGFALFAADQSLEVAKYMGLYFADTSIEDNQKYIYKIYSLHTLSGLNIDTGYVLVNSAKKDQLLPPISLAAQSDVKRITLSWNAQLYENNISSWYLERSDDGGNTFKLLTPKPIVYIKNNSIKTPYLIWSDSVSKTGFNYFYRIKGKNIFGELTPPSTVVSAFAKAVIEANPNIISITPLQDSKAIITWKFEPKFAHFISKYSIWIAPTYEGPYQQIEVTDSLTRSKTVESLFLSNYYKVIATNIYNEPISSFPILYQPEDYTPPAIPKSIKWTCDTNGKVTLTWQKNKEIDLLGYRIFRSNGKNLEFTNITSVIKTDTFFIDSLYAKALTKKFYYKIIALDIRLNKSNYSELIEVKKPDKIPPTAPVFTSFSANDTSIFLNWSSSKSLDVVYHKLMRSTDSLLGFKTIFQTKDTTKFNKFNDLLSDKTIQYFYKILAVDEDSNVSVSYKTAKLKLTDKGIREALKNISFTVDRDSQTITLKWGNLSSKITDIVIYRYEKSTSPRLYKRVSAKQNYFVDEKLKLNTTFYYRLQALHSDGGKSILSDEIIVNY